MASRFSNSTSSLHSRDPRSALFEGYNPSGSTPSPRPSPNGTVSGGYGYGYGYGGSPAGGSPYGNGNGSVGGAKGDGRSGGVNGMGRADGNGNGGFRVATPNSRGQYSDAVLNELESQNDGEVEGILGKVKMLKDMTIAIGDEIRDSSAMAEKMNDGFDATRVRLRGTMNRMLLMAERTGVGWRVWLGFFAAVGMLFFYVWVF